MSLIERFADALAGAHQSGELLVLDSELDALPVDEAPAVQAAVMKRLKETAPASKVAINKRGRAVMAPMFGSRVVHSGATLSVQGVTGLEVEIAVLLGQDVMADTDLVAAVASYHLGIELIGPRLRNHREVGLGAFLADNLINNAYVYNSATPWPNGSNIAFPVTVEIDGVQVVEKLAANPFGTVLAALDAYRKAPFDRHGALKAGHLITTGALCGVIPVSSPCAITARMDSVDVSLLLVAGTPSR